MLPSFLTRAWMPLALAMSFLSAGLNAQSTPRLTLFNNEGLEGAAVILRGDVSNLQDVPAAEGFDGTANDYAFSLKADGIWLVCMDAGFATDCREVSGKVPALGNAGGSISSVRYLGRADPARGATVPAPLPGTMTNSAASDKPPLYNTDLFGSDLREIIYDRPGSDWKTCKASCDAERQCKAWTYVIPGRTEHGECFLKDAVPEPSESECCVSGIKRQPSRTGYATPPPLPRQRMARRG